MPFLIAYAFPLGVIGFIGLHFGLLFGFLARFSIMFSQLCVPIASPEASYLRYRYKGCVLIHFYQDAKGKGDAEERTRKLNLLHESFSSFFSRAHITKKLFNNVD